MARTDLCVAGRAVITASTASHTVPNAPSNAAIDSGHTVSDAVESVITVITQLKREEGEKRTI